MKMYHSSMIPPEIIKKEGLSRKSKGLTVSGEWAFDLGWYNTNNIIFLSLKPNQFSGDYIYEVDVSDLELLPDYPSLVDSGAYVSEVGLSWTRVPSCLRKIAFEGEVVKSDLDDHVDCCIKITKSAATRGPISPNRIRLLINEYTMKLTQLILEKNLETKKLIEFPEFRQAYTYDCGTAVFQAILAFFGIDEREEILLDTLKSSEDEGTSIENIKKVAKNEYDIETKELKNLTIDSLKKLLDQDKPVLMLIQAWSDEEKKDIDEWEDEWEEGHYVVAIGYTDKEIIFEDPSMVVRTYIPFNELDKRWHDVDVTPKGKEKILDHWGMIFSKDTDYEYDPMNAVKMEHRLLENRIPICRSKAAKERGVDGHAICYYWDYCKGFKYDDVPPCQDEKRDIRQKLQSLLKKAKGEKFNIDDFEDN